jgi:hypothetical protein
VSSGGDRRLRADVLTRHGYETAVQGKNGWVCMVERGWMAMFDNPEFWNPKVRAADCLNPPAARFNRSIRPGDSGEVASPFWLGVWDGIRNYLECRTLHN